MLPEFDAATLPPKVKNLFGQRFGLLTVTLYVGRKSDRKSRSHYWGCSCDCGGQTEAVASNLTTGKVRSCGCVHFLKESNVRGDLFATQHGLTDTRIHRIWRSMVTRCTNPNRKTWHRYGGRGIKVCDRWRSFSNFYEDMGLPPSEKHTLDRTNNDGNYCPENCQWATRSQQARNRSNNRLVTFNGKTQTLIEWSEETGISFGNLSNRLKLNWGEERALTTPVCKSGTGD